MNGKTHKISRRLSVIALAASIAAIAVPAATAGPDPGDILGTGIVRSQTLNLQDMLQSSAQEHGAMGFGNTAQAVRVPKAARVLGPSFNTVEKRGPYGAYWVLKGKKHTKLPLQSGIGQLPRADDGIFRAIIQDAASEHGASGFGNTTQAVRVLKAASSVAPDYSHLPEGDRPSGTIYGQ